MEEDVLGLRNQQVNEVNKIQIVGNKLPKLNSHKIQLHSKPNKNLKKPTPQKEEKREEKQEK